MRTFLPLYLPLWGSYLLGMGRIRRMDSLLCRGWREKYPFHALFSSQLFVVWRKKYNKKSPL
jgi:hypothetical protein